MSSDLITLKRAKIAFPQLLDTTQDATISVLITAASRAIERYCKRKFLVNAYDELYDAAGDGVILLRNFPVVQITRLALSPVPVLQIQNANVTTTVSRATVATTLANAADWPAASTGIVLTRVDNTGTVNTDATITWGSFATVTAVANQINTLGLGWKATVQGNYGIWPSADIAAIQGALSAAGNGANLKIHTADQNNFSLIAEWGELRFSDTLDASTLGTGAWFGGNFTDVVPGIMVPRGNQFARIQYSAGFNILPDDLQQACALLTATFFADPAAAGELESESLGDYSYRKNTDEILPKRVRRLLLPYRDHRV